MDDNELAASSLRKKLANLGFTDVELCIDSKNALNLLEKAEEEGRPFKIAFIDMVMDTGIDGWHLAFDIKQSKKITSSLYLLVPEGQMHEDAKEIELEELVPLAPEEEVKVSKNVGEGLKILVAEDHPMNRKLLETFLKKLGAEVYLAENGEKALEIIKNTPEISMIFMDIYMPEKNGIEATKELRAMHYNEIIIACTANNDTNDFNEYKRSGINDILVKPFKHDTLRAMLEKWKTVLQTLSVEQINLISGGSFLDEENNDSEVKSYIRGDKND